MSATESKIDGYLQEKAMYTLSEIVSVVRVLNEAEDCIPSGIFKDLKDGLRAALFDSTKVVAYMQGSIKKQNWGDVDLILDKEHKGLSEVLFKYGCIPEPEHLIKDRERPHFALRVLQLTKLEMREARRAIYDECDRFGYEPAAQIRDLLEGVTQNTKEWTQFQKEVELILRCYLGE